MFLVPILLLTYNRPQHTQKILDVLRQVKPTQLFWASDGAKTDVDNFKCEQVKQLIHLIDWDCEVKTLWRTQNLGCGVAVSQGISWFFEQVPAGIILEDDCLPDVSFFFFCETLLQKYQNEKQVYMISGVNFCSSQNVQESYYFSHYPQIWGWASWRRAWQNFEYSTDKWQNFIQSAAFGDIFTTTSEKKFWTTKFTQYQQQNPNLWALRWLVSILRAKGLCIVPQINLVSNTGFDNEATHTKATASWFANMPTFSIKISTYPTQIKRNEQADRCTFYTFYNPSTTLANHLRNIAYKILPKTWQIWLKAVVYKFKGK